MYYSKSTAVCLPLVGLLAFSGCTVGDDYSPPLKDKDQKWHQLGASSTNETLIKATQNAATYEPWWLKFNDPNFKTVISMALVRNNDLKIAQSRVVEARASASANYANLFPQIQATGNARRGPLGGSYQNRLDSSTQAGLNGTWDLDAFGGNKRRYEAAQAEVEAQIADAEQTRLKLVNEVARAYVNLRSLQQQRILTARNVSLQEQTLHITDAQFKEHVVTRLDVLRAKAQLNLTKSRLPQIDHGIYTALNRLAVLLDETVEHMQGLLGETMPIPKISETIVVSTPVDVLQIRPDIKAAERRLAGASAMSGAAFAEFFPKLSLEGFFGTSHSNEFGTLSPWSAAINAVFPLLNFGRIQAQVDAADARQQQAYYTYHQTVLAAVEEVEVSFSAYRNENTRQGVLKNVVKEQSEAVHVARTQYANGFVPQLDLLNAQQNLLDAETSLVQSNQAITENAIRIYTALGQSTGTDIEDSEINSSTAAPYYPALSPL